MQSIQKIHDLLVNGNIQMSLNNFEPTDTEGKEMAGHINYYGIRPIILTTINPYSYEMQAAKQICDQLQSAKVWVDDIREAPEDFVWLKSVNQVKEFIGIFGMPEILNLDHDAGDYVKDGGDYIKILDWMEENNYSCKIGIHSANPVGIRNMQAIARKNGWSIL